MKTNRLAILFLALAAACGGGAEKEAANAQEEQAVQEEIPTMVEVVIEANDQMKYNLDRIDVKAGQKVKLTLKHVGQLPIESMGHNWVLLKQGTDVAEFATAAINHKDNGYIDPAKADQVIVKTDMIGGGQETTIEFDAPEKGIYDFICTFPGHYGMMKGKFVVM
ncbi:MAG: plastocyanin/azurin family copper-binding protein [Thermaurantimonas sp.]|uniref:plastocyanin/azurin family copper-binding protein n=1 Tax=Thermaurantimonas sp. TaxID=2681568 RepID=UPI0039196287